MLTPTQASLPKPHHPYRRLVVRCGTTPPPNCIWFGPVDGWVGPGEMVERMEDAFVKYARSQPLRWRLAMRELYPIILKPYKHKAQ